MSTELGYYLGRDATSAEVEEAEEWQIDHPGVNLSEYVDAMLEIGAL